VNYRNESEEGKDAVTPSQLSIQAVSVAINGKSKDSNPSSAAPFSIHHCMVSIGRKIGSKSQEGVANSFF